MHGYTITYRTKDSSHSIAATYAHFFRVTSPMNAMLTVDAAHRKLEIQGVFLIRPKVRVSLTQHDAIKPNIPTVSLARKTPLKLKSLTTAQNKGQTTPRQ